MQQRTEKLRPASLTSAAPPQCVATWLNAVEDPAVIQAHIVALSDTLTQGLEPQFDTLIDNFIALLVRM